MSLYDVPATSFGLYMVILRKTPQSDTQYWQILLQMCICGVKNTVCSNINC